MADETKDAPAGSPDLAAAVATISALVPELSKLVAALAPLMGAAESTEAAATGGVADSEVEGGCEDKTAPPAEENAGEGTPAGAAMDEGVFLRRIAKRDSLARQISAHVGTFDHAEMTLDSVVAYGCEKLGIKAEKGQEVAKLEGFLQAKGSATPAAIVAQDSAAKPVSFVERHLKKEG